MQKDLNILIADDSKTQLLGLEQILQNNNFTVTSVEDGLAAFNQAKNIKYDLLISDVMMPHMNGFELCTKIKNNELGYDLKVILLTTLSEIEDISSALEAKADYYITKPYTPSFLVKKIEEIISGEESIYEIDGKIVVKTAKKDFTITSSKSDLLKLLFSSWEHTVNQNRELLKIRRELNDLNKNLEKKVQERTKELTKEIEFRKQTEEQIKIYHLVAEQNPNSILITDTEGNIEYVNEKFTKVTGFEKTDVIGKNPRMFKSDKNPKAIYDQLWNDLRTEGNWEGELINKRKNGEEYPEEIRISSIRDKSGSIAHYAAIKTDITDRKIMINKLIEAEREAQKSDKLKSDFLAQISHEIRTPLNAILNYSELIKASLKPFDAFGVDLNLDEAFESIQISTNRLTRTIELMINLSEIQSGNYQVKNELISINELLNEIIENYQEVIQKKNLNLIINDEVDSKLINMDRYGLYQVLVNIIDNSIKFTNEGEIKVTSEYMDDDICISISDTGIGIDEEYMSKIFNYFSQEEHGYTRKYEGNGLGLALTSRLCKLLDITFELDSVKGEGTTAKIKINKSKNAQ